VSRIHLTEKCRSRGIRKKAPLLAQCKYSAA
jgi:hypothetical protein